MSCAQPRGMAARQIDGDALEFEMVAVAHFLRRCFGRR